MCEFLEMKHRNGRFFERKLQRMLFPIEKVTNVRPFLKNDPHELDIWSNDYFLQLADRMVLKE